MLHETKGQMVDNDTVPALARWLKYAFPLVQMNVALRVSRRWKSLNFTQVCVLMKQAGGLFRVRWPVFLAPKQIKVLCQKILQNT